MLFQVGCQPVAKSTRSHDEDIPHAAWGAGAILGGILLSPSRGQQGAGVQNAGNPHEK